MTLSHLLRTALPAAYPVLRLARLLGRSFPIARTGRQLRVLMYHDIAPEGHSRFAEQLRWLSRRWTFADPGRFAAMIDGDEPVLRDTLLLSFDDGFASNREVAERILAPMGIRALFFVVSDFVGLNDREVARSFIANRLFPGLPVGQVPTHLANMTWPDLEALLEQGHHVGAHTASHARLSELAAREEIEREVAASADMLEGRLGYRIEHFAYPFGDLGSFSRQAMSVAARRFRYVHSGLRGNNSGGVSPLAIRRDAVATSDSLPMLGAFLEGGADLRYQKRAGILDGWAADCRREDRAIDRATEEGRCVR